MGQSETATPAEELKNVFRAVLAELIPEVMAGRHLPIRAKVLEVQTVAAGQSGPFEARYAATVQPLLPDGSEDKRRPALEAPLQPLWTGPGGEGLYRLPPVGATVRVVFDFGDPSRPVIVGVLPFGGAVPDAATDELVVHNGPNAWLRLKASGEIILQGAAGVFIGDGAGEAIPLGDALCTWLDAHVHLGNLGAPTGPPSVPTTPALVSAKHKVK